MPATTLERSLEPHAHAASVQVSRTVEAACRMVTRQGRTARSICVELSPELIRRCGGLEPTVRLVEGRAASYEVRGELTCVAGHLSVTLSSRWDELASA